MKNENAQLKSELDKASNGKFQQSKAAKVDQMMRSASCMVTFSGWQNLQKLRENRKAKTTQTQTTIKNIDKALIEGELQETQCPVEAPVTCLTEFRKLPYIENETQFDEAEYDQYMRDKMKELGIKVHKKQHSEIKIKINKVSIG